MKPADSQQPDPKQNEAAPSKPKIVDVRALYGKITAHAKTHVDSTGNANAPDALDEVAFNALRSEVHAQLQAAAPPPDEHPDDEGDPELHHARQKAHFKALWKEADKLIASAGITPKGKV